MFNCLHQLTFILKREFEIGFVGFLAGVARKFGIVIFDSMKNIWLWKSIESTLGIELRIIEALSVI